MAILKIARMGHPVLSAPTRLVADPCAQEIRNLVNDMIETMQDANGAGLAAPQVHVPLRLVVFQAPGERAAPPGPEGEVFDHTCPLTVLINPEITVLDGPAEGGWEGCLSVPGLRGQVPRWARVRYSGLDPLGRAIEREADGFHARVVQHECDHLIGRLYPTRMRDLTQFGFTDILFPTLKDGGDD